MSYPQPAKQATSRAFCAFNIAVFTVGTEVSSVINVAVQLQDARGQDITKPAVARVYLSDNANGHTLAATLASFTLAIGTNGVLISDATTAEIMDVLSNGSGQFDLDITQETPGVNYYLVVVMPDGSISVSPEISF